MMGYSSILEFFGDLSDRIGIYMISKLCNYGRVGRFSSIIFPGALVWIISSKGDDSYLAIRGRYFGLDRKN